MDGRQVKAGRAAGAAVADTSPPPREAPLAAIERDSVFAWKRTSGYDGLSHAENAWIRYPRTFGGGWRAKRDASQERETMMACGLLNRMRTWGRPRSDPVR